MMIETSQRIRILSAKLDDIVGAINQIKNNEDESYVVINSNNSHQPKMLFPVVDDIVIKEVLSILETREKSIRIDIVELVA